MRSYYINSVFSEQKNKKNIEQKKNRLALEL